MKKFLLSFAIILLAKNASTISNGKVLVDELKKILEQTEQIQKKVEDIHEEKMKLELNLTDVDYLYGLIELELMNHPIVIEANDALNEADQHHNEHIDMCEDIYNTQLGELFVEINVNARRILKEDLHDIDKDIDQSEKDLNNMKKNILNALDQTDAHSAVCENNNEYCRLLDDFMLRNDKISNTVDALKTRLSLLIIECLSYLSADEATSEIRKILLIPVVECLKGIATTSPHF